jgi:hypothetical protein
LQRVIQLYDAVQRFIWRLLRVVVLTQIENLSGRAYDSRLFLALIPRVKPMNYPLRVSLNLVSMLCGLLISLPDVTAAVTEGESAPNRARIFAEATALIARVRYAALITVDGQGQPRSLVVDAFEPDGD